MINGFAITQQGRSHSIRQVACQDFSAVKQIESHGKTFSVAIIADGVGSCKLSGEGAKIAVTEAMKQLEKFIKRTRKLEEPGAIRNLKKAFNHAANSVNKHAEKTKQDPDQFSTTLTAALYDGKQLFFGHCGDGGIVGLNGRGEISAVTEQIRAPLNIIMPLQKGKDFWDFGSAKDIVAFALMTDGVLDANVRSEAYDNRIYVPFFNKCFFDPSADVKMKEHLSNQDFKKDVSDDITLVCVANQAVRNIKPPVFDEQAWRVEGEQVKIAKISEKILKGFYK